MVGVVIATHGRLAEAMVRTAEGVVGKLEQVLAVAADAANTDIRGQLKESIKSIDTGVNLPMLLKLQSVRQGPALPIAAVAQELAETVRKAIGHVRETLRRA